MPDMPPGPSRAVLLGVAYRTVILAAILIVLGLVLPQILTIVLATIITVILALPLISFTNLLARWKVPRVLGAILGMTLGLGVFAGLLVLIVPRIVDEAREFADDLPAVVEELEGNVRETLGLEPGRFTDEADRIAREAVDVPMVAQLGLDLVTALAGLLLILVSALYIAINPTPLKRGIVRLFPPDRRDWAEHVMERIRVSWLGWLRGTLIDMVAVGVLLYIGLLIVGLDLAIFFAVLGGLLEFIPYIGPIAASVPAIAFGLAHSFEQGVLTALVFLVVNQVEGNVLVPVIMSQAVELHPAVIAIGIVVVGLLFGLIGLLVAVPILAAALILVEEAWVKPREESRGPPAAKAERAPPGDEPVES